MAKERVWIRLGGLVTADKETMKGIRQYDVDALVKALKENGFAVEGETYIPEDGSNEYFDVEPNVLNLKAEKTWKRRRYRAWIRLGGWVTADEETMRGIRRYDVNALVKAIKANGFAVDGEAYIPDDGTEEGFDIEPNVVNLKAEQPTF